MIVRAKRNYKFDSIFLEDNMLIEKQEISSLKIIFKQNIARQRDKNNY